MEQRNSPEAKLPAVVEEFLDTLADRLAERVAVQLAKPHNDLDRWLTTREAARYLGIHPDTLRRWAAAGAILSEQDEPGCALHFRLSELDRWRESGGPRRSGAPLGASTRLPRIGRAA
jgi:excisionase family DNA binding protein